MEHAARIESALSRAVEAATGAGCPKTLAAALRDAVFPGGARLRPTQRGFWELREQPPLFGLGSASVPLLHVPEATHALGQSRQVQSNGKAFGREVIGDAAHQQLEVRNRRALAAPLGGVAEYVQRCPTQSPGLCQPSIGGGDPGAVCALYQMAIAVALREQGRRQVKT